MIKNLIFDFGKVLVDYDFEAFFRKYIPDESRCRAFNLILNNADVQQAFDREEHPFEVLIDELVEKNREFEPELRMFSVRYPEIVTGEVEGMRELLVKLKSEGYKLYGLSNWCSKVSVTMAQYDIFGLLDGYVVSSDEKVVKPEAEIYHRLFDKYDLKPDECVFADDKKENIEGGRQVGMDGIVFTGAEDYERRLREMVNDR